MDNRDNDTAKEKRRWTYNAEKELAIEELLREANRVVRLAGNPIIITCEDDEVMKELPPLNENDIRYVKVPPLACSSGMRFGYTRRATREDMMPGIEF